MTRPAPTFLRELLATLPRADVEVLLCTLPRREGRIVRARSLALQPMTLRALGVEFGLSFERIRQLELRAIRRICEALNRR